MNTKKFICELFQYIKLIFVRYSGHKTGDYYIESCVDHTDSLIFSGSTDGAIWCWDLVKMNPVNQLIHSNRSVVHSISSHASKGSFLSASGSNFKVWSNSSSLDNENESET